MSKTNPVCSKCGIELNDENWYPSFQKNSQYICKTCNRKQARQREKMHPGEKKAQHTRYNRKQGHQPFNENKRCSLYLGVHIAEQILSLAFKNVQRMPMDNPGFDFICGKGYMVDVKSACKWKTRNRWLFHINHNTIADYFLLLTFDNREDLNPEHIWLIPGDKVNHLTGISISQSTIHKWDEYQLDVTKVTACCNTIRSDDQQKHEHG